MEILRISLRPLELKDAEGMYDWMTDPTITQYFRFDASSVTIESCAEFIRDSGEDPFTVHFAIVNDADEYLGTISLKKIDNEKKCGEYAISTRKIVHGKGVAGQATEEILKIAFEKYKLDYVYLNVLIYFSIFGLYQL